MHNLNKGLLIGEVFAQTIGQIDRSVLPTGASNGHSKIAAVIGLELRNPSGQKANNIGEHGGHIDLTFQKLNNLWVLASQQAQFPLPMRVGKTAHIENKIGILWGTALKPKALKQNGHMLRAVGYNGVLDQISQLVQRQSGGIYGAIGDIGYGGQHILLQINRLFETDMVRAQWMLAPGFTVSAQQIGTVGI